MRVVEQSAERRLGRDAAHEHQLARRHGRERRELRRGAPARGRTEQVFRILRRVVRMGVRVSMIVVIVVFCCCCRWCVVGIAVSERDDRWRVQVRFIVCQAGRWAHMHT